MGEYAEMMLDGTLCEGCGSYIDDDGGEGFPRYCSNRCARDRGALHALPNPTFTVPNAGKTNCPACKKRVKKVGLADHIRDVHTVPEERRDFNDAEQAMILAGDRTGAKVAWHKRKGH